MQINCIRFNDVCFAFVATKVAKSNNIGPNPEEARLHVIY